MKIESGRSIAQPGAAKRTGTSGDASFAPSVEGPAKTASASGVRAPPSIDALLALQGDSQPGEKRARQIRRGRDALDALAELERGLLFGAAPAGLRERLQRLAQDRETTGESGLDEILTEIDTRVAVELAKLEMSLGAGR